MLPQISDILLTTPLYKEILLGEKEKMLIYRLFDFTDTIDTYCIQCKKPSTFKGIPERTFSTLPTSEFKLFSTSFQYLLEKKFHNLQLECTRDNTHSMVFNFCITDSGIIKIGQYPSSADLAQAELTKYKKVLSAETHKELVRGVGLHAHGVGVGAFVYLRRIFENLIEEAHVILQGSNGWDETIYRTARMEDRIVLLKQELPNFLVDNHKVYSILSKGIHELSEEECLTYFDTLKVSIELILSEYLEKQKKKKLQESISKDIQQMLGELNKGKKTP